MWIPALSVNAATLYAQYFPSKIFSRAVTTSQFLLCLVVREDSRYLPQEVTCQENVNTGHFERTADAFVYMVSMFSGWHKASYAIHPPGLRFICSTPASLDDLFLHSLLPGTWFDWQVMYDTYSKVTVIIQILGSLDENKSTDDCYWYKYQTYFNISPEHRSRASCYTCECCWNCIALIKQAVCAAKCAVAPAKWSYSMIH